MAKSKKTDLDPAVVAEIASKSTKELEAATGMHARAIESIRDAMAEVPSTAPRKQRRQSNHKGGLWDKHKHSDN